MTKLKYIDKVIFFLPFYLFTFLPFTAANAQILEITAKDTTGLSQTFIANNGDFTPLSFTNGRMTYDRPNVKPYDLVYIMGGNLSAPCVVESGQTLQVNLVNKKGKWTVEYKGKNANASYFNKQLENLMGHGWEIITLDEYDDEVTTLNKDFDFDAEMTRLAKEYENTKKSAEKVENDSLRKAYLHTTDVCYLASRINCLTARDQIAGEGLVPSRKGNMTNDTQLDSLISTIDPNDDTMQAYGLVERYLAKDIKGSPDDENLTDYAVSYIKAVDSKVKNPKTRHQLLNDIASTIFNSDNKTYVLDDFWSLYKQAADTSLVNYYQTIVDSKLATKSGTPCPDEEFEDINGNKHKLSEFWNKGKYTYIDMWATWCIPCVKEIPYVKKHVAHYKDNPKIQFVSISLDNNHDAWKRKLAKDNPQWPQFISATKEEMNKLMNDWGVTGIPRFIIINPDGTINNSNAFRPSDENFYELMDAIIKK